MILRILFIVFALLSCAVAQTKTSGSLTSSSSSTTTATGTFSTSTTSTSSGSSPPPDSSSTSSSSTALIGVGIALVVVAYVGLKQLMRYRRQRRYNTAMGELRSFESRVTEQEETDSIWQLEPLTRNEMMVDIGPHGEATFVDVPTGTFEGFYTMDGKRTQLTLNVQLHDGLLGGEGNEHGGSTVIISGFFGYQMRMLAFVMSVSGHGVGFEGEYDRYMQELKGTTIRKRKDTGSAQHGTFSLINTASPHYHPSADQYTPVVPGASPPTLTSDHDTSTTSLLASAPPRAPAYEPPPGYADAVAHQQEAAGGYAPLSADVYASLPPDYPAAATAATAPPPQPAASPMTPLMNYTQATAPAAAPALAPAALPDKCPNCMSSIPAGSPTCVVCYWSPDA